MSDANGSTANAKRRAKPSAKQGAKKSDVPKKKGLGVFGVMLIAAAALAVLAVGAAGGAFWWLHAQLDRPGPFADETVVQLAPGTGLNAIAARLESDGLIRNRYVFRAGVTLEGDERSLKAGEYAIPAAASMRDIYRQLSEGRVVEHAVTLAEGLTSRQIVAALEDIDVLEGEVESLPEEGTLLPETYQVVRGTSRQALVDRMAAAQDALIAEVWDDRDDGLPFDTIEEAIILASIVEKETGVPEERDRVAAVFVNRLKRGMRLETDPTIIYGISGGEPLVNAAGQRRPILLSELNNADNPYNTYHIDGLPPGPICNPGADSIRAVLHPADTGDVFFVADGTGGHAFASTLAQHNRNVARWRAIERERIAEQRGGE